MTCLSVNNQVIIGDQFCLVNHPFASLIYNVIKRPQPKIILEAKV